MLKHSKKHGNLHMKAIALLSCLTCCTAVSGIASVPVSAMDVSDSSSLLTAIESGTVTLADNITVTNPITITNSVTIELNNHTITYAGNDDANGSVIRVESGGALTLTGNGTITGGKSTSGGGVYVANGASFTMNGGTITGNTATDELSAFEPVAGFGAEDLIIDAELLGGGVYVAEGGIFTMNGGTITGNKAEKGGGVYVLGTFNISDSPVITENHCNVKNQYLNNVYLGETGKINVIGTLTDAKIGVSTAFYDLANGYEFTNGYKKYNANSSVGTYFTSDDTAAVILQSSNGEAMLQSQGEYTELKMPTCTENGHTEYWTIGSAIYTKDINGNLIRANEDDILLPAYEHSTATRIEEGRPATYDQTGYYYRVTYCTECETVIRRAKITIPKMERPEDSCTVSIVNGKLADGSTSAIFNNGTVIAVTADEAPDGQKFGYWTKNGTTISYNPVYTFAVTSDNIALEAHYVEDTDNIEKYGNAQIENVVIDSDSKKLKFVSVLNVPEDCTIKYAGIVATNNAEKAENLTAENADFKRGQENPEVHSYKYTWTKSSVQADETWYVKGYLVYTDADGNEKTIYSDMAKATLDGYEIIEEEKILGTAMIDSVNIVETNKLRFVSLTSVPADCTIQFAGIVATNDAEKSENLTAENADFVRGNKNLTVHNYKYTWTKSNVQANETWYVKSYLVYTDAKGKTYTVYGDLRTGTLKS